MVCKQYSSILAVVWLWFAAVPVKAEPFSACADSTDYTALAGSLCKNVAAPLAYDKGDNSSTIALFIRKFPVADAKRRRGAIWLVAGGPGESGAAFYPLLDVFRRAFPDFDLIIPDHRGTGYSSKICPEQEAPESPDGIALAGDEWGPCIASVYQDVARARAFTITNAAQDLSLLIGQNREPGETYVYGVSYGTQLVLRMMQAAPVELDGILLDGLVPPESSQPVSSQRWDLSHRTDIVDSVGRALLSPQQTTAYAALLQTGNPVWQDAVPNGDLRRFFGTLLNFPELRARIPQIIDQLARQDVTELLGTKYDLLGMHSRINVYPQSPPSLPLVSLVSGSENNDRRAISKEMVAAESDGALFTSALPGLLVDPPFPLYDRDASYGQSPQNLPRTLVLQGTLDPNTPYEGAVAHAKLLSAAGQVEFATVEHGAHFLAFVAPECFIQAASAFVAHEQVPERCAP